MAVAMDSSSSTEPVMSELREAKVVVVSTPACQYCKRAKQALDEQGVPYVDLDVSDLPADVRKKVKELTGSNTVPQIFVNGASVGGSDTLLLMLADGSFQRQAASSATPALPSELLECVASALSNKQAAADAESSKASAGPSSELLALLERLRHPTTGIRHSETRVGQQTYRTFTAEQLVAWLAAQPAAKPAAGAAADSAAATAQALLDAHLVSPVPSSGAGSAKLPDAATITQAARIVPPPAPSVVAALLQQQQQLGVLYTLTSEAPPPVSGQALNTQVLWYGPARPANQVANELRSLILALYDKHLSKDGSAVNYKGIAADPLFGQYVAATAELQQVDLRPLSVPERKAFFINTYNALIVHALVVYGTAMTSAQRAVFYSKVAKYVIGGQEFTADDMENGVLRGNRAAASNLWNLVGLHGLAGAHFHGEDPRKALVAPCDPRIHFALVCGAKSCPPIKLYTPDNIEEGLEAAAEAFVGSDVTVDRAARKVALSKIFKWYAVDFGSNKRERLQYVLQYLQGQPKQDLNVFLNDGGDIRVEHKPYDWGVNDSSS